MEIEENNRRRRRRHSELTIGAITVSLAVLAVTALAGWVGWQTMQAHDGQQHRAVILQVGRQAAIDLTSIDYTTVEADIQRILDASVGTFHDEFQSNATGFANVVRQAQTKSQDSVTDAGVESIDGPTVQILVTASVKTSSAGARPTFCSRFTHTPTTSNVGSSSRKRNVCAPVLRYPTG
jgi:Mce-associated membrane protein